MPIDQDTSYQHATQFAGIVFSKDRPLQLEGTLRSFYLHCKDPDNLLLKVLYVASTPFQQSLYCNLKEAFPAVEFVQEASFKRDLLSLLKGFTYVLFLVDDNIFVEDFSLCEIIGTLNQHSDALGFSLRLGENTTYCYMLDKPQRLPAYQHIQPNVWKYDWTVAEHDFGYPLELSSSVYSCADIMLLLEQTDFNNPNSLESHLAANAGFFKDRSPYLLCYSRSVAFCAPINKVQTFNQNRAGENTAHSPEELARLYGKGNKLDVSVYAGFVPASCHQEIELKLVKQFTRISTVSIVIPCYNQACFLEEAVESVVAQSFNDWECIIVNDGSPDDTSNVARKLIAAYPDKVIRLVEKDNGGLASARNAGIRVACGKYILPLDADDKLHPNFLKETVAILDTKPEYAIVYVDEQNFGNASHIHQKGVSELKTLMYVNIHDYCSLYRRKVWQVAGGYSPAMYLGAEDWNFWVAAAKHGFKSYHLPLPLFLYRNRESTMVAETMANIQEVWAHIVFHHPELYDHNQRMQARANIEMMPPKNMGKLDKVRQKHCTNTLLNFFAVTAENAAQLQPLSMQPLVTVVIPTKDRPELLKHALSSIMAQDYPTWEAIVVNDGGASIKNMVESLDPRIRCLELRESFRQVVAKNLALRISKGEIVCYLDDDDMYFPCHLSTVVDALKNSGTPFVYTDAEYVLEELHGEDRVEKGRSRPYANIEYSKERLHVENFIPINTWGHRWNCLQKAGFFDESLTSLEDWELLLRFSRQFKLHHISKVTVEVRQRITGGNVSSQRRPDFPRMFRIIYGKHDDLGNAWVRQYRALALESLDSEFPAEAKMIKQEETDKVKSKNSEKLEELQRISYQNWVAKHTLQEIDGQLLAERMVLKWTSRPVVHFIMRVHAGDQILLADTLDSLSTQMYPGWRLSVIADFPPVAPVFSELEILQWFEITKEVDVPETINQIISIMAADWVGFVPPGVRLTPQYLISCADYINIRPHWRLIYTDSDDVDDKGVRSNPQFRPDFNLDLLRSMPYMGNFLLKKEMYFEAGGYSRIGSAEAYDLCLRAVECSGESAVGHITDVLFHMPAQQQIELNEAGGIQALTEHLSRLNTPGEVFGGYLPGTFRIAYHHHAEPLVSIIIPTKDKLEFLKPCVDSLLEKTTYPNYEIIIVDNQSADPDTLDYLTEIKQSYPTKVRVIFYRHEFNFSAINNYAASQSKGEYLLLLNNDTQIVQGEWLERMMSHAQRDEVGIVGARLTFPGTGVIQHAGVVLGMDVVAEHLFRDCHSLQDSGYMGRAQVDQNYSAVTGACLLIRKSVYEEVGGLDDALFKVSYNDIDLCLKVRQSGYKIVWTPYATLVHHGSATQKEEFSPENIIKQAQRTAGYQLERQAMLKKWMPLIANDPAYNRHLSLVDADCRVEGTVVIDWDVNFHDRPRILGVPLAGGVGEYRMISPFRAISNAGMAQTNTVMSPKMFQVRLLTSVELERAKPDSLVLHTAIDDSSLKALQLYKQHNSGVSLVFGLDDLVTQTPEKSAFHKYALKDAKPRLRKALSLSDRLIVSTQPLADLCKGMIDDIRIIPNRLERAKWGGVSSLRGLGNKPRVGWAGAQQHDGDLGLIHEVVKATAHEIDWVFFGMCPAELRPHVREFHDFVLSFEEYPAKLASLNLDLAVAPLELHPFNEAKSNLRLLEYGIMGWPVVCTDISSYQDAPVKRVPNQTSAWIEALRERIHDLDATYKEGDQLREWVLNHYMLEDHLVEWMAALLRS